MKFQLTCWSFRLSSDFRLPGKTAVDELIPHLARGTDLLGRVFCFNGDTIVGVSVQHLARRAGCPGLGVRFAGDTHV